MPHARSLTRVLALRGPATALRGAAALRMAALMTALLGGCEAAVSTHDAGVDASRDYEPEVFEPTEATIAYCGRDDAAIEARITELLAALTPNEKLAMMSGAGI